MNDLILEDSDIDFLLQLKAEDELAWLEFVGCQHCHREECLCDRETGDSTFTLGLEGR